MPFLQAPQCPPGTVLYVFHHFVFPQGSSVESPVDFHTVCLGVYSSFFTAQAVAVGALEFHLGKLQSAGISGKFCKDIDLVRRGLITQVVENGQERPLSEYEIRAVPLEDRTMPEKSPLEGYGSPVGKPKIVISLPPQEIPAAMSDIEQDPLWAQSRIPYYRKRDEGPFRSIEDPPYAIEFFLSKQVSEVRDEAEAGVIAHNDSVRYAAGVSQQATKLDDNPHSDTMRLGNEVVHETQGSNPSEQIGVKSWKHAETSTAGPGLGDVEDIGPIYSGRRHSTFLN